MHTTASHFVHGAFRSTTERRQTPPKGYPAQLSVAPAFESEREDLWATVSDSLAAHLAVLDETGTILAVNHAWSRFAIANDARDPIGPGWNYLDACDAAGDDEPGAAEVGSLIRAIIGGADVDGITEYPCHSPHEQRWFSVRVAPYRGPGRGRVVVGHIDITERVLIGEELRRTSAFLQAVTESVGEGLFALDSGGRVVFVNEATLKMLGFSREELEGSVMHELTHYRCANGARRELHECPITVSRELGEAVAVEDDVFVRADGTLLPVSYTAAPFETPTGDRGSVVVFRDTTEQRLRERRLQERLEENRWERRLRDALANDRFVLHAQPIVGLGAQSTLRHELLIRLDDGNRLIPPAEFLPVAERVGLTSEIDRWVVSRAVELARDGAHLDINLSALSLEDTSVLLHIERELEASSIDPARLTFEVTETALTRDFDAAAAFLGRLRELGCKVALDDFGTGYAGFTYLKKLPVDSLKIDREFVAELPDEAAGRYVVEAVVRLAASFGLTTVAEGVETEAALNLLKALGVDDAQGYLLGRPKPAAEAIARGGARVQSF